MSSYRETMAEVAALFGQKYAPEPPRRSIRQRVKSTGTRNGTIDRVFKAIPTTTQGQASATELAAWTRCPVLAVREALRSLVKSGRITRTKVGCQPRTVYRYHREKRVRALETWWADVMYRYIHRMRGHWLRASDIRKGANIPEHISIKRVIHALRDYDVIEYHPLTAVEYQVRWARSRPCGAKE